MLLLLLVNASCLTAQAPLFFHYTSTDGLPSNNIYFVDQDEQGYIWITTDRGVSRFNGQTFTNFDKEDGLSDNDIFSTQVDQTGRRWFLGSNGRPNFQQRNDRLSQVAIDTVKVDGGIVHHLNNIGNDTLLFGMKRGVWWFDQDNQLLKAYYPKFSKHVVFRIWESDKEQVQLLTNQGIFIRSENGSIDTLIHFFPNLHFTKSILDENKNLLFLHGKTVSQMTQEGRFEQLLELPDGPISLQLFGKDLWVGTVNGVYRYQKQVEGWTLKEVLLKGHQVAVVHLDAHGGLWIGTLDNGLYYAPKENIRYFSNLDQCQQCRINRLYETPDQELWALSHSNLIIRIDQEPFEYYSFDVAFFDGKNVELHHMLSKENINWLFSNGPIIRKSSNGFMKYSPSSVYDYLLTGDTIFLASTNGVWKLDWTFFQDSLQRELYLQMDLASKRLLGLKSQALFQTKDGRCWIGTVDGLYWNQGNRLQRYEHPLLPSGTKVTDIENLGDWLMVSTAGNGLIGIKGDQHVVFTEVNGLNSNFSTRMRLLDSTTLLLGSSNGMNCFDLVKGRPVLRPINSPGNIQVNDFALFRDHIYLATHGGLVRFPKKLLSERPPYPHFYLREMMVNDSIVSDINRLAYHQNNLRFEFESVAYNINGKLDYKYKLEGFHKQWVHSAIPSFELASLSSGTYTLLAKTCFRNSEICSPVLDYTFTIYPPFWSTWWFRTLCILGLAAMIYLFFRIRILTYNRDVVRELLQLLVLRFKKDPVIIVKDIKDGSNARINLLSVKWITSNRNYISFYLEKEEIITRAPLKEIEQQLNQTKDNPCVRIHRSYIVNKTAVQAWHSSFVKIGDQQIPVGPAYKDRLEEIKR